MKTGRGSDSTPDCYVCIIFRIKTVPAVLPERLSPAHGTDPAGASGVSIFDRFFKNYSTIVENSIRSTELVNRIFKNVSYRNEFFDTKLKSKVHLENKKGNLISSPKRVYSDNTLKEVSHRHTPHILVCIYSFTISSFRNQ